MVHTCGTAVYKLSFTFEDMPIPKPLATSLASSSPEYSSRARRLPLPPPPPVVLLPPVSPAAAAAPAVPSPLATPPPPLEAENPRRLLVHWSRLRMAWESSSYM